MPPDVRAALLQLQPALGEPQRNLATLTKHVAKAKADLCVFPELYLSGYFNRDALRTLAEPLDGPLVKGLAKAAKQSGAHIITGMPRASEVRGVVHNSSVLVTPGGEAFAYDKLYLPSFSVFEEDLYFGEGRGLPTFKTDLGRIGMSICYDLFFPEITKAMAMQGADVLTCISASPTISRRYFEQVLPARAIETTCFLLFTNLVGPQDQVSFWGGARAFSPRGEVLAQGPLMKEAATKATLDLDELGAARLKRPLLRDTRPELAAMMDRAVEQAMPRELRALEVFHGRPCGGGALGLRLGKAARHALRQDGAAHEAMECDVALPLAKPHLCVLDGLQLAGCSTGRGNLRAREGAKVEAWFSAGSAKAGFRVREAAFQRALTEPVWVFGAAEDELFEAL